MSEALLQNRDYTIIFARTAVESEFSPPHFAERWANAEATALKLLKQCEAFDPDGITLYVACRTPEEVCSFKKLEQVTSATLVEQIREIYPPTKINLQQVLQVALDDYFRRKAANTTKVNGEIILVLLDGEPSDRLAVAKAIRDATHKMEKNEELGVGLVQIGDDPIARGFLTSLDHDLKDLGAKFDIVHTRIVEQVEPDALPEFLLSTLFA